VGYFAPDDQVITLAEMRTTPYPKSDASGRKVCFCFDHTVESVLVDVTPSGTSNIKAAIMEACGRGQDDCERMNPEGRCCLGNIARLLKRNGGVSDAPTCCSKGAPPETTTLSASTSGERR